MINIYKNIDELRLTKQSVPKEVIIKEKKTYCNNTYL